MLQKTSEEVNLIIAHLGKLLLTLQENQECLFPMSHLCDKEVGDLLMSSNHLILMDLQLCGVVIRQIAA